MLTRIKKLSLYTLITPIVSMSILTLGNGFYTTLTTLRLDDFHASAWVIGIISAAYFSGMFLAAFSAQKVMARVGYIRSYAFFASLLAFASLTQGLFYNISVWIILRFVCGFCITGLFIVIENWCLEGSSPAIKGFAFSVYLFSYYLAQSLGQLFLKFHYSSLLAPFCIIAGTACISVIPVSMTYLKEPKISMPTSFSPKEYFKKVPLGIYGGLMSGVILGGIYTLLPLSFMMWKFNVGQISYLMGLVFFGGTIFQIPIGKISDKIERRLVLIFVCLFCAILSLLILFLHNNYLITSVIAFLLGGFAFVIYPLSISHATDYTETTETLAVLSTMSLTYGIGSTIGPIIISNLMNWLGASTIFLFNILACTLFLTYAFYRKSQRKAPIAVDKSQFVPVTQEVIVGADQSVKQQLNAN